MQSPTADNTGVELVRLLERQRDIFQQLRSLADRQRALVIGDDPKALLVLLAERQRLVDDLGRCNTAMAGYRRNWSAALSRLTAEQRRRVDDLLHENDRILGSVLSSDQADAATLSARQRVTAGQMAGAIGVGRASRAYAAGGASSEAIFADACI
jgi:hypothetical protein